MQRPGHSLLLPEDRYATCEGKLTAQGFTRAGADYFNVFNTS